MTTGDHSRQKTDPIFYGSFALLAVVVLVLLSQPEEGVALGLLLMVAGVIWGDVGKRFVVPFGAAIFAYWITTEARPYTSFFEASAQVVPVLILAAVVEQRDALRDAVLGQGTLLLFGATLSYMLLAEISSLYAVAVCAPDARCASTGFELGHGVSVNPGDETLASWVAGGLGGGLASLVVAALLPRRAAQKDLRQDRAET